MEYSGIKLPDLELLSDEETNRYIKLAQEGDESSLDKLVEHNLRLVLKISCRFKNLGFELEDLFQVGVIGLIKAAKAFDIQRGVKFSTYAVSKIIGEIRLYIRDDGIIKVSRSIKNMASIVRKKEEELKSILKRPPSISELSAATELTKEDIVMALEAQRVPSSIYQKVSNDNEKNNTYLLDFLSNEKNKEDIDSFDKLELIELIRSLEPRSRKIIFMRYFEDKTQQEVAEEIGVSQVQVSRLEKRILRELRESL
ncbi:MAG: sigma-70 family RNA polymerase sigma factor [Halanaerobiaceae bacterium]|nr:sigma-70 family RNA polymerase sigma factor [Halanaerobiaceae bacterium]